MNKKEKQQINLKKLYEQKEKYYKMMINITDKNKIDSILEVLNTECKNIRMPKYSNEYYLYYILTVLNGLQSWVSLNLIFNENLQLTENHYKTIQDKHLEWSKLEIYKKAYNNILINKKICCLKKSANLNLYIDSTNIYNLNGSENIGYGYNPKKKETKVSTICNINKIVLSHTIIDTVNKKQNINTNNKDILSKKEKENKKINLKIEKKLQTALKDLKNIDKKIIQNLTNILINKDEIIEKKITNKKENIKIVAKKTLQHDSQTIEKSLDNLLIDTKKCKKINLIADKGYIKSQKDKNNILNKYNTNLIHPNRKNQKENTLNTHKKLLKNRYVIENVFAKLKKFGRICSRKDKLSITYEGFLFLATILTTNI